MCIWVTENEKELLRHILEETEIPASEYTSNTYQSKYSIDGRRIQYAKKYNGSIDFTTSFDGKR